MKPAPRSCMLRPHAGDATVQPPARAANVSAKIHSRNDACGGWMARSAGPESIVPRHLAGGSDKTRQLGMQVRAWIIATMKKLNAIRRNG